MYCKEAETEWSENFRLWKETSSKKYLDKLWLLCIDCCKNIALNIVKRNGLYGKKLNHIEERAMDAAVDVMRKIIVDNYDITLGIAAYASPWVRYHLQHKASNLQADREYQIEENYENRELGPECSDENPYY